MNECSLGILGFGRIGRRVAEVASAIGFRVLYNDHLEIPESSRHGAEPVSLEKLLSESDVLSVHIDGRESNHGFLDAARYRLMKDDATLLNTSRGVVLDEVALAAWLSEHPRALAVLDVHAKEPFEADAPLLRSPNARLMPHLASRTRTALANMSWVVKDVWRVLEGEEPIHDALRDTLIARG
jgi:phosphoglycerate dehydrogenase-like enzyme